MLLFGRTSTLVSIQVKFEEVQLMNFKQGVLEIKESTLATLALFRDAKQSDILVSGVNTMEPR